MISIRRYLDSYRRAEPDTGTPADLSFQTSLAHLATVLVSEIGAESLSETDPAFEPFSASIGDIQQRLEAAESPDEIQALSVEIPQVLQGFRRAKQEVDHRQTEEVQKIVAMLQQTIEALSRGNDRSMTRLRRIESQIRSASQISEIVALRERLRSCVDQIRDEAAAEQRDFAKTKSGSRPGTATSAPWSTTPYGTCSRLPSRPSGRAGSSSTIPPPVACDSCRTVRASPGVGSNTGDLERSIRKPCRRSNSEAPLCALVRTVSSSAGSRRNSSYRYDWMPPSLGGKSLVTSM